MAFVEHTLATVNFDPANKEQAVHQIMWAASLADSIYAEQARAYNAEEEIKAREREIERLREYANNRYKRQSNRDNYFEKELAAWEALPMYRRFWPHNESIEFVDYQFDPRAIGIPSTCIVNTDATQDAYERMYEEVKDNKYFKQATGLSIVITIDTDEKYLNSHFRPHAKLILPEAVQQEYDAAAKSLVEDVTHFYENTTYWGD